MPFTEAMSAFYSADDFATTASYAASGGVAAVDVAVIFDQFYRDPLNIESQGPMLRAELALMPDIQHTDRFTINGTVYAVRQVEKHTPTHGEVMVRLKEAT